MTIAIIGFSRFGQLWARLMKPFGRVIVFNRSDQRHLAKEIGVDFFNFDQLSELKTADWIFLAVAISATEKVIKEIKPFVGPQVVVMDVCSVKALPCRWLQENFPPPIQTMGTHPMFGPDSVKTGLAGKQMILCPLNIDPAKLDELTNIFKSLKLKVLQVTPAEHDQQTAYSLALVHFLGRGLEQLDLDKITISTLGFERLLEVRSNVSHDSWQLFEDLEKLNPFAEEMRQKVLVTLQNINRNLSV
jgi:prephenate dehydrogenase